MKCRQTTAALLCLIFQIAFVHAEPQSFSVGALRLQCLSPTLLRVEVKGPKGFEDAPTFHIVNRDWPGAKAEQSNDGESVVVRGERFQLRLPKNAKSLEDVKVESRDGQTLWSFDGTLVNNNWLPGPSESGKAWAIADTPRLAHKGDRWDDTNDAP